MSADLLPSMITDRDEAISRIRVGLKKRTGRTWSVTGGRGTAWGWIRIGSPPARLVCYTCAGPHERHPRDGDSPETLPPCSCSEHRGYITAADRAELAKALGLERVHFQGVSVPSRGDYRAEYVARAEGREVQAFGTRYWD